MCFGVMVRREEVVDAAHGRDFLLWSGREDDALDLEAFAFAARQDHFGLSVLVEELAPEAVAGCAALSVAKGDEPALSCEDLGAEFPTVLAGHGAFEAFHDRAHWRVVGGEVFGAILDGDVGPDASVFVVRSLVGFLESSPPADVVHEDCAKVRVPALDGAQEFLQRVAAVGCRRRFCRRR